MKFSEIVRMQRNERGLDLRALASLSNIAISFISEIENEISKPTMTTAVNLVYALGISLPELIARLEIDNYFAKFREYAPDSLRKEVLQVEDIDQFLKIYNHRDGQSQARELLYDTYTFVMQLQDENPDYHMVKQMAAEAVFNATCQKNQLNVPLPYPSQLELDVLEASFTQGGVIIFPDVGYYIRKKRIQSHQTLMEMSQKLGISHSALSRLERGERDRIHLHEVIDIDRNLGSNGYLLEMCWAAAQFATGVQRNTRLGLHNEPPMSWTPDEYTIGTTIVRLDRWYQSLGFPFAEEFRAKTGKLI